MTQGIYEIVNLADGKASSYVGSSAEIEKRWVRHIWMLRCGQHDNAHLQAAWDKYGEDAFVFSVLEEVSDDMLLIMEQEYLGDYLDRGHCYNIATDALAPMRGRKHTEGTKRKMSGAKKGKPKSEETRCRMSAAKTGNQYTLGYKQTNEHKRKRVETYKATCAKRTALDI